MLNILQSESSTYKYVDCMYKQQDRSCLQEYIFFTTPFIAFIAVHSFNFILIKFEIQHFRSSALHYFVNGINIQRTPTFT